MRMLGVDFGQRRIGLALSDGTAVLARPWRVVAAGPTPAASAGALALLIARARAGPERPDIPDSHDEPGEVQAIVVGLPRRLNGEDTEQTQPAREFAHVLGELTGLMVHLQDERLTSHEADRRLAEREPDWRRRKQILDAASAAIILQDFLDERARQASRVVGDAC